MIKKDKNGDVVGYKGETSKAHDRRKLEGWFEKYAPENRSGVDIGSKDDPLNWTFRRWDFSLGDSDATEMAGVPDETYQTVYASHVLEHLTDPRKAIKRWYEILKPGGHLIMCVPHRDLYEKKKMLPSHWNHDHKKFWLPEEEEMPCTLSFKKEVLASIPDADIVEFKVLDDGYEPNGGPLVNPPKHPIGEYAIEIIVKKPE